MSVSILVVDDESDVADLFRQRFRRETREALTSPHFALSAEEGSTSAPTGSSRNPSSSCPTSTCPGWTASCSCAKIKSRRPDLPVMMVTAYGDDERRRRASEWGAA
jgi:CheY-like chemotaxis protein